MFDYSQVLMLDINIRQAAKRRIGKLAPLLNLFPEHAFIIVIHDLSNHTGRDLHRL